MNAPDTARPPKPVCPCRVCGAVMDAFFQPGSERTPGTWQVTCFKGCWMHGYTRSYPAYLTINLDPYKPDLSTV